MSSTLPPITAPAVEVHAMLVALTDAAVDLAAAAGAGKVAEVRGPALVELTAGLWAALSMVTSVTTHATSHLHVSGELSASGFISTKSWLSNAIGLGEHDAKAALGRATSMHTDYAATWAAWNSGDISIGAAREITMGLPSVFRGQPASVRDAESPVAESILLEVAKVATINDVAAMVQNLRAVVNTDGTNAAALAAYDDQSLSCTAVGSMSVLSGHLSAESHALLATALEQIIDGWYRSGSLSDRDQPSTNLVHGAEQDRRARNLRRPHLWALALVELARRQLDNGSLGSRHEVKPHLNIVVDVDRHNAGLPSELRIPGTNQPSWLGADTIRRIMCDARVTAVAVTTNPTAPGRSAADTNDTDSGADAHTHDTDSLAETSTNDVDSRAETGTELSSGALPESLAGALPESLAGALQGTLHLAGHDLTTWLREAARTVLYVGRARRIVPRRMRVALEIRDKHCTFPGCTIDASRCDAHHVKHWEHNGPTDISNTLLLCPGHHHLVHEGGWTITANPDIDDGNTTRWNFTPPRRR